MAKQKKQNTEAHYFHPSPLMVGLCGCCPRCGKGRLYSQWLTPADSCRNCGLDYTFIDSGDGPAVFVILIIGFIITGLALFVQTTFAPPWWVHIIVWLPTITLACFWSLRFAKALMIALQYKTKASQGILK